LICEKCINYLTKICATFRQISLDKRTVIDYNRSIPVCLLAEYWYFLCNKLHRRQGRFCFGVQMKGDFSAGFDLELPDFDFGLDDDSENRLIIPKISRPKSVKYENALKFAKEITIDERTNYYAVIAGNFIYGDFIEALHQVHRLKTDEIYITTLGMSENNVDSIKNLALRGVKKINLITSNYFFGVERHNLIPYITEEYAGYNITVAVAGSRMKLCLISANGLKIVMYRSANLSSSNNIEQMSIVQDPTLYDFNKQILDVILEKYTVYDGLTQTADYKKNKANYGKKLWEAIK